MYQKMTFRFYFVKEATLNFFLGQLSECAWCEIWRVPLREGGGPGHDLGPAVLHRVRHRPQHREAVQPLAQLHPRLLPTRGQLTRAMAPARHSGIQKGKKLCGGM